MIKYLVVAKRWNEEKQESEKYIAGAFDCYMNAIIFRDGYNSHYSSDSEIVAVLIQK